MPTLSNDQHYTFIAEGRTSIDLVIDSGSMASVSIRRSVSEGSQQKYYESATVTGIYPGDTVTIAAESGSVTYTVTNLSAVYATDPSGAVTGLVGPDGGTISIAKKQGHVFACLGDSISYQNTNGSSLVLRSQGYMTWASILSGGRIVFEPAGNFGVSGESSTQIAGRVNQVVSYAPSFCVVLAGTNDLFAGPVSYETTVQNLATIYSALIGAGIVVVAVPVLARSKDGASGSLSTADRQQLQRINNWIRRKAATTPGILLADPTLNITDHSVTNGDPVGASTAAATAYTVDGLHPAPRGAFFVGKAIADAAAPFLDPLAFNPVSQIDTYSATNNPTGNLLANGFFTGTGGTAGTGASGDLAASWQFRRSAGATATIVGSKTTKALDNGLTYPTQRVVCAASGGSSTENLQVYQFVGSNFTPGTDVVYAEIEVEISGISVDCVRSVQLNLGDSTNTAICNAEQAGFYFPNQSWTGVLRTPAFTIASAATTLGFYLNIVLNGSVASNSITVDCRRAAIRKVV